MCKSSSPQNNHSQNFIAAIKYCIQKVYLHPKKCYYLKLQRVHKYSLAPKRIMFPLYCRVRNSVVNRAVGFGQVGGSSTFVVVGFNPGRAPILFFLNWVMHIYLNVTNAWNCTKGASLRCTRILSLRWFTTLYRTNDT